MGRNTSLLILTHYFYAQLMNQTRVKEAHLDQIKEVHYILLEKKFLIVFTENHFFKIMRHSAAVNIGSQVKTVKMVLIVNV